MQIQMYEQFLTLFHIESYMFKKKKQKGNTAIKLYTTMPNQQRFPYLTFYKEPRVLHGYIHSAFWTMTLEMLLKPFSFPNDYTVLYLWSEIRVSGITAKHTTIIWWRQNDFLLIPSLSQDYSLILELQVADLFFLILAESMIWKPEGKEAPKASVHNPLNQGLLRKMAQDGSGPGGPSGLGIPLPTASALSRISSGSQQLGAAHTSRLDF